MSMVRRAIVVRGVVGRRSGENFLFGIFTWLAMIWMYIRGFKIVINS